MALLCLSIFSGGNGERDFEFVLILPTPQVTVHPAEVVDPFWGSAYRELAERGYPVEEAIQLERLTAFNPVPRQTDDDPFTASCGPNLPNGMAVSRDHFFNERGSKHLCGKEAVLVVTDLNGKVLHVEDRIIWDTMASHYTNTGDVFMDTTDETLAFAWGIKRGLLYIH